MKYNRLFFILPCFLFWTACSGENLTNTDDETDGTGNQDEVVLDTVEFRGLVYLDSPSIEGHLGGSERIVRQKMEKLFNDVTLYWNNCGKGRLNFYYRYVLGDIIPYDCGSNDPDLNKMVYNDPMDFSKYDLSALEKADVAGEALNPEVFERFQKATGIKLHEGFGQTETCILLFTNQWIEPKPGSMGMPAAGWDVMLLDEGGRPVPDGTVGEICISLKNGRPVGLFQGYHKNEKLTAKAFRDGIYHTGDVAYRDNDGYYWFVGRNDDLIKTSGYRVSPFEVESVLLEHPAVREVAVTGVPDPSRGMAVKATIVLNKYFQATDVLIRQLQDHVRSRTAAYKYPRVIEFVDSLPMTISGKIRRALIRTLDSAKANIIEPVKKTIGLDKEEEK